MIMDLKGDFTVTEFSIGKRKQDYSYARLLLKEKIKSTWQICLNFFLEKGQLHISLDEVKCTASPNDMVLPDDFYSTTNNTTQIFFHSEWINVENMMMDKCIVLDPYNNICSM